jgi:integrase
LEAVYAYVQAATAANTRRAYRSDVAHFMIWGGRIPTDDATVERYLAEHATALSIATLCRRLSAISKAHRVRGLSTPTTSELVRMTLRGIRRVHGRPQKQVAPILREDLQAIVEKLGDSPRDCRDRALLLIGFAGAFRRSELVAINCKDVERVPQGIVVTILRSKTDQERTGRRVGLPSAHGPLCPLDALDRWLNVSGIVDGPLFRRVDRHHRVGNYPLSPEAVALIVKGHAAACGLDPTCYAGHSLRAGLATSAVIAGVPSWKVREQTGHASEAMLQRYIRRAELFVENAAAKVL